ncbi:MAG: transglutaminase domain-containing protein [Flavobacteriaceae bacterium]
MIPIYFNFCHVLRSIGQINVTVLSGNKLNYKLFNNAIKPTVSNENNLHQYRWNVTNTNRVEFEQNTPSWKLIYDSIFISGYNSWEDVVNWGIDVYTLNEKTNPELLAKINEINTKNESPGDKIKATLDFVQNEIRYLGLESGIGGYKPFLPNQVFERRFGDCKDKSLLMSTMLSKMGIDAYPMLVNTYLKHTINDLLPSPKFFDHCVVKVENGPSNYYYDPTISNQGGDYALTHFPDYKFGLVLKEGNTELDEIKTNSQSKVETFEEYTIDTIGKGAKLKVVTTYYESEADNMRNYFKNNSVNSIKKEYENFYSGYYFNVSAVNPPRIKDNKYSNKFEVFEEYKIDSIWQPMVEKENHISVAFSATSLLNILYIPTKDKRDNEVSIIYPIIREHKIKVNLPTDWGIKNEKLFVTSPGFYYEWKVDYNKKQKAVNLYYYLATQKDYITTDEYKQYIQDVKKVEQSTGYFIFVPENYSGTNIDSDVILDGIINIFKFLFFLAILVVVVLLIFWQRNKNKKAV